MYEEICPYCQGVVEINHDDGYGYEEEILHQQQCRHCEKYFVYTTSIQISHTVYAADCLNGAEHRYEKTKTVPEEYAYYVCTVCGEIKRH